MSDLAATFSPCRRYRYTLWRGWSDRSREPGQFAMFIGLNPSTADETNDDPTVRRCIRYAKDWGYSGLLMTNIFAWRDTDPVAMMQAREPIGADTDRVLLEHSDRAGIVVCAWGVHGVHMGRGDSVRKLLATRELAALRITKDGHPCHPLYLPASLLPMPYLTPEQEAENAILQSLRSSGLSHITAIAKAANKATPIIAARLLRLELTKRVRRLPGDYYEAIGDDWGYRAEGKS